MFEVTETAARQIQNAAREGGTEGMALRLAARRKGDGSFDYAMGFDEVSEDDIRFQSRGVDIVMAPEYVPLLDQTVMDYVEIEDGDFRFIFMNPQDPSYVPPAEAGSASQA